MTGPSMPPPDIHMEYFLIASLRRSRSPWATSTWNEDAMITTEAPISTWERASSGMPVANTVQTKEARRNQEPYFSIFIGPMESMSCPAGMAMTIGKSALSVTISPTMKVDAPSSVA